MNQENEQHDKGDQTQINDSGTANVVDNTSSANQSVQGNGNNLSINHNTYNSKYDQREIREFLQDKLTALPEIDEFKRAFAAIFIEIAQTIPYSPTLEEIIRVKND